MRPFAEGPYELATHLLRPAERPDQQLSNLRAERCRSQQPTELDFIHLNP